MKKDINALLATLYAFQKVDPEFPLQYAICLIEISLSEGISLTALSETTGMPISTISRIVGALSKKRQKGKPYNLVRVAISAKEKRRKELYLTSGGQKLIKDLGDLIKNSRS